MGYCLSGFGFCACSVGVDYGVGFDSAGLLFWGVCDLLFDVCVWLVYWLLLWFCFSVSLLLGGCLRWLGGLVDSDLVVLLLFGFASFECLFSGLWVRVASGFGVCLAIVFVDVACSLRVC